ncbi:MAG: extracellular solute-binding protein, partial [Desulfobacterales bacterium]|nr:extracellular solute-binding protein [Desulfobacterales bacterium]
DMGAIDRNFDYGAAQEAFLNGEIAVLINGTWVPDTYSEQAESGDAAISNYGVSAFPNIFGQPASWIDSHMWIIPTNPNRDPDVEQATLEFMKFLNDNNFHWARTGHMSVRQSVIASEAFQALPKRSGYAGIAQSGRAIPRMKNYTGFQDSLQQELRSTWQNDKDIAQTLQDAEARASQVMNK